MEDAWDAERRRQEKALEVDLAIREVPASQLDIAALRRHCASPFGLVRDDLRVRAWPLLLDVDPHTYMDDWRSIPRQEHRDSRQINLDCVRSFYNYDLLSGLSDRIRTRKVEQLEVILNLVLQTLPGYYYNQVTRTQGFHDICTVLLLVCGEDLAFKLAHRMAQSHFRECMRQSFDGVVNQMGLIYPMLQQWDPALEAQLRDISPQPAVAIPFIITGFQHDISSYETATRVFDFLIAMHPSAPIYMSAVLLRSQSEYLVACEDMAELHTHMKAALEFTNFDQLCSETYLAMKQLPPSVLPSLSEEQFLSDSPMLRPDDDTSTQPKASIFGEVAALAFPLAFILISAF